ncbi:MAG: hypothetical protein BGP10_01645 [Rhodanobacter sp. 68-29]|nr:hypothetical protein [Rhodanobacter sp.]ODU74713.1 MAG: hypothetical protein ABT17_07030 [Rhodanobacter sp. SCN 69-32]OJY57541.1 MAG: hypothetical protein BGP10_01645 [Rhodanobacter sp. 68-29]
MSVAVAEIVLRDGRLHMAREVHERVLFACENVALLARGDGWLLMPLRAGAGGLQVKLRNARGDRVVESQEFFRNQGIDDSAEPRRLLLVDVPGEAAFAMRFDP